MNKIICILGGSKDQLPIINLSKEKGYKVLILDQNINCVGKKFADEFIEVNISDKDKVLQTLRKYKLAAITSMITEVSVLSIYYCAKVFNLPNSYSYKSAIATLSKLKMREIFKNKNINNIPFKDIKSLSEIFDFSKKVSFPLVLKRSNSGGQKDLFFFNNKNDINSLKIKKIKNYNEFICEKFISGDEINCVVIVYQGRIKDIVISDRVHAPGVFGVVKQHIYPSKYTATHSKKIYSDCEKIINELGIEYGPIFLQFIVSNSDLETYLVELGVRIPGGKMDILTSFACGIDLVKFNLDIAIGEVCDYSKYLVKNKYKHIIVTFFSGPPGPLLEGKVLKIDYKLEIDEHLLEYGLFSQEYESSYIYPLTNGVSRFMYCVTVGSDFIGAFNKAKEFFMNTEILDPFNKTLKAKDFNYENYYLIQKNFHR